MLQTSLPTECLNPGSPLQNAIKTSLLKKRTTKTMDVLIAIWAFRVGMVQENNGLRRGVVIWLVNIKQHDQASLNLNPGGLPFHTSLAWNTAKRTRFSCDHGHQRAH